MPARAKKYDRLISSNLFKYPPRIAKVRATKIKKESEKYHLLLFCLKFYHLKRKTKSTGGTLQPKETHRREKKEEDRETRTERAKERERAAAAHG